MLSARFITRIELSICILFLFKIMKEVWYNPITIRVMWLLKSHTLQFAIITKLIQLSSLLSITHAATRIFLLDSYLRYILAFFVRTGFAILNPAMTCHSAKAENLTCACVVFTPSIFSIFPSIYTNKHT